MFRCIVSTPCVLVDTTTNRRFTAGIVFLTMTFIVVVTFARTLRPALALMCKKDLLRFQLKLPYFFTDLGESLPSVLETEVRHW